MFAQLLTMLRIEMVGMSSFAGAQQVRHDSQDNDNEKRDVPLKEGQLAGMVAHVSG